MKRRDIFLSALGLIIAWQLTATLVNRPILPAPSKVFLAFFQEMGNSLIIHFGVSLWRVTAGMALSVLTAAPAGLAIGGSKTLNRIFSPHHLFTISHSKSCFCAKNIFIFRNWGYSQDFHYLFNLILSDHCPRARSSRRAARAVTTKFAQPQRGKAGFFRFVYLPASLPAILTALRQSIGTAIAVLYITELFATKYGLGYYIYYNGSTLFNYPAMYAGIIAMSLLGLGMYFAVDWAERRLCRWKFAG